MREQLALPSEREAELLRAIEEVQFRQQQLWQESKQAAVRALCEGFTSKAAALRAELLAKDATVSNVAEYFETIVADCSERGSPRAQRPSS